MAGIHILDSDTINKIAAGEVVERPASVVKELVENAVDAGAGSVTVEIKEGGNKLIRVTDNGAGIPKEEIRTAFLRHATSKIMTAVDLLTIRSLGFRGEALSSIASVAVVELITKTREEFTGNRYFISGGIEKEFSEVGAPEGTTFLVRDLFYNTPARKKFLKSAVTEAGYISDLMERFATSHPEVAFKFINNNKTMLQTSGNGSLKDCIYHIYGRDVATALLPVDGKPGDIGILGFIGKPVISRGNRNYENYFINGRYIRSNIISKAIEEAYKPYTMQHKYPFTVLMLSIPPERIDVNVHPTKLEVRFDDTEGLYRIVFGAVKDALAGKNMIPDAVLTQEQKEKKTYAASPEPFEHNRITMSRADLRGQAEKVREQAIQETLAAGLFEPQKKSEKETRIEKQTAENKTTAKEKNSVNHNAALYENETRAKTLQENKNYDTDPLDCVKKDKNHLSDHEKAQQISLFEAEETKEAFLKKSSADRYQIIGQLFGTYWLVEFEQQLFIIDQHAAHEKILYERTVRRMNEGQKGASQMLSPPTVLSLSIREEEVLLRYKDYFQTLGFLIEEFGKRTYSIHAVPTEIYGVDGQALFMEMLDNLLEEPLTGTPDIILDRIASISCKAAVKGNSALSKQEAKALLDELMKLENPFHCPHGRPIIISMTKHEIERKFKRIVG